MDRLGPYEPAPRIAVAASGGADSTALALLAGAWASARSGAACALVVDHRLRPEAGAEARLAARRLDALGLPATVLTRRGAAPTSGLQAAAREARYGLLLAWCREHGILHLLTAHHADDQAETVWLRRAAGSGPDGLAGMSALRRLDGVRLLRPLLDVPRTRLHATLRAAGIPWLEDPSNRDDRFARTAARNALAHGDPAALLESARRHGAARTARAAALNSLLAAVVRPSPAGWCRLAGPWRAAASELRRAALSRLLLWTGGGSHAPGAEQVGRLETAMLAGRLGGGATLAGCRVLPDGDGWLVLREAGRLPPPLVLRHGGRRRWDRFRIEIRGSPPPDGSVGALGEAGWRRLRAHAGLGLPRHVGPTLPALRSAGEIVGVPHLGFAVAPLGLRAVLAPPHPLADPGFQVA